MMHEHGKSDRRVVPTKPPNNGAALPPVVGQRAAEVVEGRRLAKGNPHQRTMFRTLRRANMSPELERIRQAAYRDRKMRFTALFHHVYRLETLKRAYFSLNPKAAPGVDGVTWKQYGEDLEANLQDLANRLARGAYRAQPTRRTYIPKADGRQRPLGITALEDKIVQAALVEVLNALYEVDFLGFSYGSRPGRSPHDALDALSVGIVSSKVNWVLSVDIRGYFDAILHEWLVRLPAQRAGLLRAGGPRRKPPAPTPPALHRKKASLLGESPPNPLKQIQLRPIPLRMLMIADVLLHHFCRYLISHCPGKIPVLPEPLWFVSPLFKFWKFAP